MIIRILHIASGDFFSTYGGGQVYVKNVADEMIRQEIEVGILSTVDNRMSIEKKIYRGIPIYEVSPHASQSDLISVINDFRPSIIHAHSRKDELSVIAKQLNIPVVVTSHHGGIVCPGGTLMDMNDKICHKHISHNNCLPCVLRNIRSGRYWYPFMKHLSQDRYLKLGVFLSSKSFIPFMTPIGTAAYSMQSYSEQWDKIKENADTVIAPCTTIAENMILNGLDESKIEIIPHGIPLPSKTSIPHIVQGQNIKFFYVGRLSYVKGLHILLEAFLRIKCRNIELHLIGGAQTKSEIRYANRLKKRYKDDNRIVWHGKVSPREIYDLTKSFHVACSPSICLEVFGLNIAEALALGKPVLSSRNGGGEAQIEDGINGWLVPQNDVHAMKEKMEEIIANAEKIESMSPNCHANSIEKHVKDLLNVYKELL